ncbi:MAG: ABC transporter substrate-binding protein [Deltaproteobacteria bacterium]|nr:ABC transporter substrate-binding protein [Deltaproteobacteria bacterium]
MPVLPPNIDPPTRSHALRLLPALVFALLLTPACQKKPGEAASEHSAQTGADSAKPAPEGATADPAQAGKSGANTAETGAAKPEDGDVILLGEVGSLTGAQATFGISTRNGIELAIRDVNEKGGVKGKKLAVRVYDNQGKPEESANAVTRLIAQDKVVLILGEVASTNSLAMAPKAQASHVPMISPSSTNPKVTEVGDYIFRVCFIDPFQGFVMAKFARDHLKAKKAAILKDQKSDYSIGLTEVFTEQFSKLGGKVVSTEAYAQGDTDFRAQLTAIRRTKPEVLYIPGYYTDVGLIARQARQLGVKAVLLGSDGWESAKLFELGGAAIEGSYLSNHYAMNDPSPAAKAFREKYNAAYGAMPDSLAALGYDAAMVAADAIERAKDLSGPAIRDAIAATKDFPGVAGRISLNDKRNAVKPAVVLKVGSGTLEYVTTIQPDA